MWFELDKLLYPKSQLLFESVKFISKKTKTVIINYYFHIKILNFKNINNKIIWQYNKIYKINKYFISYGYKKIYVLNL